ELFCVDATNNFSRWKNAKFSGLLDAAGQEANAKRRHELLQKAEEILLDEMPIIPIYFESNRHRISPRICQWKANLLDYHLWQNIRLR
ncbi:MAG: hypothetical protein LBC42_01775, partial [Puniceicoccales bacterium]|nr:hypothetical protein [Puniceicoccales bacterium]